MAIKVIYRGKRYNIPIKYPENQPKFNDLKERIVSTEELNDLRYFFTQFNNDPHASDIRCCNEYNEYYFTSNRLEYALNRSTLEFKIYQLEPPRGFY